MAVVKQGTRIATHLGKPVVALLAALAAVTALHVLLTSGAGLGNDATMQWAQVVSNRLNDWHPPAMTRLWQWLRVFGEGSAPLSVLTILLYWGGFAALSVGFARQGHAGLGWLSLLVGIIAAALWFDPISKDSLLAAFFVLGYGLLLHAPRGTKRRGWLVALALIAFTCGVLMRHNGAFAAGPALLLAFAPQRLRQFWWSLLVSALVTVVLALAGQVANKSAFGAEPSRVEDSLLLFDLIGIAQGARDAAVFGPKSAVTLRDVDVCYSPAMWDTMAPWGRCAWFPEKAGAKLLDQPELIAGGVVPAADTKALWFSAMAQYPWDYAIHRVRHMNAELLLFVSTRPRNGIVPVTPAELVPDSPVKLAAKHTLGVVFIPAVAVVMALFAFALLFLRVRRPDAPSVLVWAGLSMAGAGMLYAGSYSVIGVAIAPRYYLLTAVLGGVALSVALADEGVRTMLREKRWLAISGLAAFALAIGSAQIGRIFVPVPPSTPLLPSQ